MSKALPWYAYVILVTEWWVAEVHGRINSFAVTFLFRF